MITNNILSYFIKDIKTAKERAFYKQINYSSNNIRIFYNDEVIYSMNYYCYNYITNITKHVSIKCIYSYKIGYNHVYNTKYLYYKKDNTIHFSSPNFIKFYFNCNKYLKKTKFYYSMNDKYLLFVSILYSKKYK